MKKKYISPKIDILLLRISDVITASPAGGAGGDDDDDDHDTPIDQFNYGWR